MPETVKKILLIEENNTTFKLIARFLNDIGYPDHYIVRATHLENIRNTDIPEIELVLADLSFAREDQDPARAYEELQELFRYVPIIILAGNDETGFAAHAMQAGAQEILVKGDFDRKLLSKAIRYATEGKKVQTNYRRLFQESPVPMYIYDVETFRFLDCNGAALAEYGYTREEFLQLNAVEIRPEEDVQAFLSIKDEMPGAYYDAGTWRHIKKDGTVFHTHIYSHETVFEDRNARIVLALNIDNKVRAEMALQRKARQVENILESITDGFYTLDTEWKFTYLNNESIRLLRHTREELLGQNIWQVFPDALGLKYYKVFHQAATERTSANFEEYYAPFDLWTSVNVYPTGTGLAVYVRDITEKKKTEERIFRHRENLKAIINNTKDIIWSIDRDYRIISANQAFWERVYRFTGKTKDVVTNADFDPSIFSAWSVYFDRAFRGEAFKTIWEDELNGTRTYEEVSFNPVYDEAGMVGGISCFARDITEQRNHQRKIEEQNEQLKKIAWIQSHEVRSPVASILGLIQLFNFDDHIDPLNAEVIARIKDAALALDKVTRKITDHALGQAETGDSNDL